MGRVVTGLQKLVDTQFAALKGLKVGAVANQATVDSKFVHLVDRLAACPDVQLIRIFAPEHGFRGAAQDMERIDAERDPLANVDVVSLYGSSEKSLYPQAEHFHGLDALVIDLPDIGSRYYTFAQTMTYCMQAAAQNGKKVFVLDRPNPIGGTTEGVGLLTACRSFCGYSSIPQRHGLTLGEIAKLVNRGFGQAGQEVPPINCDLEVITCSGWERSQYFDATGLPWILPSVNMPTLETAIVYPGGCLFEATNISEGRGTTRPFELLGAPYIDGRIWAAQTIKEDLPLDGAVLRPTEFRPKFQKHADHTCGGVQLHVTDRSSFSPFRWGLALISAAHRAFPDKFAWRGDAYEFISKVPAIDLLYGSSAFRDIVDANGSLAPCETAIQAHTKWFMEARQEFLLY